VDDTKVPPGKIKVVDRRKFTSDGDPRAESPAPGVTGDSESSHHRTADPPDLSAPPSRRPSPEPSPPVGSGGKPLSRFVELVGMLAGHAELMLVGAEGLPAQPTEAKRLIDYLGELEKKTAGNLSADESRILLDVLYHLRSQYLQSSS